MNEYMPNIPTTIFFTVLSVDQKNLNLHNDTSIILLMKFRKKLGYRIFASVFVSVDLEAV